MTFSANSKPVESALEPCYHAETYYGEKDNLRNQGDSDPYQFRGMRTAVCTRYV